MRVLFSGLVAAGLLSSHVAGAVCVPANERAALDVAGLKTQLMVITLTCQTDSQYNAFINKFKPELLSDERVAKNYFAHTYGRVSQKRQDEYMTQLANSKSDEGIRMGTRFCAHNESVFNEVLALNLKELPEYAAGRATGTPGVMTTCTGAEPAAAHSTTRRAARRKS